MAKTVDDIMASIGLKPDDGVVRDDEQLAVVEADKEDAEQSGVKGMKWGVRKDQFGIGGFDLATGRHQVSSVSRGPAGRTVDAKSAAAAHKDTYKVLDSIVDHLGKADTAAAYTSAMQKHMPTNGFKSAKEVNAYRANAAKTLSSLISGHLAEQGVSGMTVKTFPLGPNQFQYIIGDKKTVGAALSDINQKKMAHADENRSGVTMVVEFKWNRDGSANGYSVTAAPEHLTHNDLAIDEVLAHYGIRGMKWGVRRQVNTATGLIARTDSEDAIKTARIAKKLKTGGTGALSNADLKTFSERIRLEQEFTRAASSEAAKKGGNFATRFLAKQGKRQFNRVADRAIDIAIEQAILKAGAKAGKAGKKELNTVLDDLGLRLLPKEARKAREKAKEE